MATALTADAVRKISGNINVWDYPIKAATQIYRNSLVAVEDGYLISATDATTNKFVGRAMEGRTAVAAGDKSVGVATFGGTIIEAYFTGGLTLNKSAYFLADMYIVNNDTVGPKSVASSNLVGQLTDIIDATNKKVRVLLSISKAS